MTSSDAPPARSASERKRAIGRKLTVISRQLWQQFDQSMQGSGVSRARWSLIAAVARAPGTTQRALAAALEITEVSAGRLIERLCEEGLLERRASESDRRSYCVYPTPAASPLLEQLSAAAAVHEAHALAGLSSDDLDTLERLLDALARNTSRSAR